MNVGNVGIPRKCKDCSAEFIVTRAQRKRRPRISANCEVCGKDFVVLNRGLPSQCCSHECRIERKRVIDRTRRPIQEKITAACLQCDTQFMTHVGRKSQFCSSSCRQQFRFRLTCATCGNEFLSVRDHAVNCRQCSKQRDSQRKRLQGSKDRLAARLDVTAITGEAAEYQFDFACLVNGWPVFRPCFDKSPVVDRIVIRDNVVYRVQVKAADTRSDRWSTKIAHPGREYGANSFDVLAVVERSSGDVYWIPWLEFARQFGVDKNSVSLRKLSPWRLNAESLFSECNHG